MPKKVTRKKIGRKRKILGVKPRRKKVASKSRVKCTTRRVHSLRSRKQNAFTDYYQVGGFFLGLGIIVLSFLGVQHSQHLSSNSRDARIEQARGDQYRSISSVNPDENKLDEDDLDGEPAPENIQLAPFAKLKNKPIEDRVRYWSDYLEKDPEARIKLHELYSKNAPGDVVPLVPSRYDCTTYVETVIALAESENIDNFVPRLLKIRYRDGQPGFVTRNHFPETDWIPNNEKMGILKDITHQVAERSGSMAEVQSKEIHRLSWLEKEMKKQGVGRSIASLTPPGTPPGPASMRATIPYIRFQDVEKALPHIPSGTVINFVHRSADNKPVLITHQGILIREGKRVLFRHATRGGHIRTNQFLGYIHSRMEKQNPHAPWALVGINLNQIRE